MECGLKHDTFIKVNVLYVWVCARSVLVFIVQDTNVLKWPAKYVQCVWTPNHPAYLTVKASHSYTAGLDHRIWRAFLKLPVNLPSASSMLKPIRKSENFVASQNSSAVKTICFRIKSFMCFYSFTTWPQNNTGFSISHFHFEIQNRSFPRIFSTRQRPSAYSLLLFNHFVIVPWKG